MGLRKSRGFRFRCERRSWSIGGRSGVGVGGGTLVGSEVVAGSNGWVVSFCADEGRTTGGSVRSDGKWHGYVTGAADNRCGSFVGLNKSGPAWIHSAIWETVA